MESPDDANELLTAQTSSVSKLIEELSIQLMEASNNDEELGPEMKKHLKAIFVFNSSIQPSVIPHQFHRNPRAHVAEIWSFGPLHPNWHIDASNASSIVDEETGKAVVFVTSTLSGYFVNLACERISRIKWRRRRGVWRAVEIHILNGQGRIGL